MRSVRVIATCPVCSGRMAVSGLRCVECGTGLTGSFELCDVCRLPDEMYEFLMVFIKTRGSIKDMEKELGVSYPTVRARIDELQRVMGFPAQDAAESSREALDMLERGEIGAEEAEQMLKRAVR